MRQYRKRPIEIEAMQIPSLFEIGARMKFEDWIGPNAPVKWVGDGITVETLEGVMTGKAGDFLIRGIEGELYPCKADIFFTTYELV